jgi:hypothetical protein
MTTPPKRTLAALRLDLQRQQNADETERKIARSQRKLTDDLARAAARKVEIANEINRLQRQIDIATQPH